jgi:hypothetical protein
LVSKPLFSVLDLSHSRAGGAGAEACIRSLELIADGQGRIAKV